MKRSISVLAFLLRHFLFVVFAIVAGWAGWTVLYLVLLAIPVVFLTGLMISTVLYGFYMKEFTTTSMPALRTVAWGYTLYLSVPLGVYWWITEGSGALFDVFRRWQARRFR